MTIDAENKEFRECVKEVIKMHEEGYTTKEISEALDLFPPIARQIIEGYEEEIRKVAKNMLKHGLAIEKIMEYTGATKELIEEIREEIEKGEQDD